MAILIAFSLLSASCTSAGTNSAPSTEESNKTLKKNTNAYKQGEILVKFKDTVSKEDIKAINKKNGAEILEFIKEIKVYRLKITTNKSVAEMVKIYSEDPRVEYAEPNYIQRKMGDIVK